METSNYPGVGRKPPKAGLIALIIIASLASAKAMTFTVTSSADTDGSTCGADCTLRQAVNASNANPPPANATNLINFNITGAGVHTITLTDCLGRSGSFCNGITQPVVIDGYSQPGAKPNTLSSGDNAVILIKIIGDSANDVVVRLCSPTTCGIAAGNDSSGSTVKGLCLAGDTNTPSNTLIFVGSNKDIVTGNFLGVNTDGATVVSDGNPVQLTDGMTGNVIGGTSPGARNVVVSGAVGGFLALVYNRSDNTVIQGNYLGVNAAGTAALGSNDRGIHVSAGVGVTVGGATTGAGNVINGAGIGVIVDPENASHPTNTVVQGNLIGTAATGTVAFHTLNFGIQVGTAVNTTIGGNTADSSNLINGTINGIIIVGNPTGIVIQGNKIGTDISGTQPLGNSNAGIDVGVTGAASTTAGAIGGTIAGQGNTIAFNGTGIVIGSGNTGWSIEGNLIFSNTGLGIDLNADGVTLDDTGDGDSGANNLQNFPVLTSVSDGGGMTNIAGRLNSVANTTYRIEFFANDALDTTGYGEGQTFIGFKNVTTNGSGDISFNASFNQIGANQRVTATATDPNGNTSEFSGSIGQLLNISTRMEVQTGNSVLIGGFIVGGSGSMQILLRALGPTLQNFGVAGFLTDPTLELHDGAGNLLTSNDNWKDTDEAAIMATGLAPPNDLESAILDTFTPGSYTGIVRGKNNTTGVALIEAYDLSKLVGITLTNISTRGFVDINQNVMIGGFISGNGIVRIIIRALGPTLSQFGVPNVLADPTLELHDANGAIIASNDNWKDTQQAEIQASGKAPPNDLESAIIAVRPAANSTAIVQGKNGTTGNALVEVYVLPP